MHMTNTAKAIAPDFSHKPASSIEEIPASADDVWMLFQTILDREVREEEFLKKHDGTHSIAYWVDRLIKSEEFRGRFLRKQGLVPHAKEFVDDAFYRSPSLAPPSKPSLVLLTGSCLMDSWEYILEQEYPNTVFQRQIFNNASELEDVSAEDLQRANFQVIQIPLRSIIREAEYFSLSLSEGDKVKLKELFSSCVYLLKRNLEVALKYNRATGIPAFVLNFGTPQANALGFLMPKYDLTNFSYFVSELNRALYEMISNEKSVYMIDYDEITSTLGKRYIQDDITSHSNHGSFIGGTPSLDDMDLTPLGVPDYLYGAKKEQATLAVFNECVAHYNILTSANKIKLVIFDLDGTLWRGVPADRDELSAHLTEGWPLSILEAVAFLKKRGILLAIASKNDPEVAQRIWSQLYGSIFPLSNFVTVKFSWDAKANSVGEILRETNLLAGNCLFVDDNPIERERVQLAFPEIKTISGPIFTWRRTLLWAAELQTPVVTDESVGRTESIRSMIQRETVKTTLDEDEYLRQLAVRVQVEKVNSIGNRRFQRAFELLNKTNQFNTTGRRWTEQEISRYFADGGCLLVADVSDRLTNYGLTAMLLQREAECSQMVMSCRIFGLRVEFALFRQFLGAAVGERTLLFRDTSKNALCRKFLQSAGIAPLQEQAVNEEVHAIAIGSNFDFPGELLAQISNIALS